MPPASTSSAACGSTSSIVADTVTGWHVLKIECYSATKDLDVDDCVTSSTFRAAGHSWCIAYFPNGKKGSTGWVSLFLYLEPSYGKHCGDVRALYEFSLLDLDGTPGYTVNCNVVRTFNNKGWGHCKFIRSKVLDGSRYVKDDCFSIRIDITVVNELVCTKPTDEKRQFVAVPPSDLHQDLGRLLSSGQGSDVTFDVSGEPIKAHKNVVAARSSVFSVELFGPMKENTAASVIISDMEASVFRALLHFIYTDALPDTQGEAEKTVMAQHLLVAADRYDLKRLKLICEERLCNHIDRSTVTTTLVLAEQHGCQGLKEACLAFLTSPGILTELMGTDDYDHLTKSCPSLVDELVAELAPKRIRL